MIGIQLQGNRKNTVPWSNLYGTWRVMKIKINVLDN